MTDWGAGTYELTAFELAPVAERLVALAAIQPGERVLDVACGTGNAGLAAAARGAVVTGLDSAPRLVSVANQRAQDAGVDAMWIVGDATRMPLADQAFDVVLSVFGVIFAEPAEVAAAELMRVLAPGGRIVLSAWLPAGPIHEAVEASRRAVQDDLAEQAERLDWSRPETLARLLPGFELELDADVLAVVGPSPDAYAREWFDHHPAWLATRALVAEDRYAASYGAAVSALREGNEDPQAFRATSPYVTVVARRPGS